MYFWCPTKSARQSLTNKMSVVSHAALTKTNFHNYAASSNWCRQRCVSHCAGKARAPSSEQYFVMVLGEL